ncbi:MAG: hypothetical protein JWO60_3041, partial [Frankiales bacterium]|nr:hypothetical protein [Frankiales bacterium]
MARDVRCGQTRDVTADAAASAEGVSRLVAGVAVAGAVVLLGGLTATTRGVAAEHLETVVASAERGATVQLADRTVPAVEGSEVPDGATVATTGGTLVLRTGDRTTRLAPSTRLEVLDGARQRLVDGTALVDATRGPAGVVLTDAARVEVPEDALVRLEASPVLRVAAYRGAAAVHPAGRRSTTDVGRLHQVRVPQGALPGRVTPLALTEGDRWERTALRAVVDADRELTGLAADLASGGPVVEALPAALTSQTDDPAVRGELGLALALAQDGGRVRDDVFQALVEGRQLGGSWGVVARLAGATVEDATDYLSALTPEQVLAAVDTVDVASSGLLPAVVPAAEPTTGA